MSSPPALFSGAELIPHIESQEFLASFESSSLQADPHSHNQPYLAPLNTTTLLNSDATVPLPQPQHPDTPISPNSTKHQGTSRASQSPSSTETSPTVAPPALRRSTSNSSASGSKKRLRFTPMPNSQAGPSNAPLNAYPPGEKLRYAEEGRHGKGARGYDPLRSDPGTPNTPNILETADQIRRTLSLANLDSLLLLSANPKGERERLLAEVSKAGRELVWRDKDEEPLFPRDTERALVLAFKRGLRSFILSFSVRSGINVLLLLFRSVRRKPRPLLRLHLILHAIFGPEPFRFGAMIGTFTFLNTLTLHLLRLAPPLSYLRRRIRAGIWKRTTFGPPEREGEEGERRWQAAVAGGIGSLGLLWETSGRRTGVAQQMFVRGLQAAYNQYTPRFGIHIPHGALLVFGACCGQIMFSFLLSPETIPKEYNSWILQASRVPEYAVLGNRTTIRQGMLEPAQVQRALQHKALTPSNRSTLEGLLEKIRNGWKPSGAVPCEMVHPWCDSCVETDIRRFFSVFRFMLPVYSALHIIPMLVLRRQHVQRDPLRMLARAIWGITRSCSFLGVFVMIYQTIFCARTQFLEKIKGFEGLKQLVRRKESFWLIGFSTCLSLLVEEKKRRAELAMYVLPRALESAWSSARRKAWVPIVPFGETILGGVAMAMVMDAYKHQPDALSGIVRRLLFQLVGPI